MPLPSSRMTKQPAKPVRYFPGKAYAEDPIEDEESDEEEEAEDEQPPPKAPAPKATSFPKRPIVSSSISNDQPLPKARDTKPDVDLEGFETASESSQDERGEGSSSEEEESSEEEDSDSDDEPKKPMLAPKFISKAKRAQQQNSSTLSAEQQAAEEERKRKEKADELLQAQIERDAAARRAGKKYWDDDDVVEGEVDDTDDVDPEAEKAAWKLRELKRVQRDRQALIAKEKEREEVERRRNLTAEEREAEDREYLEKQAEEREGKGKMAFMQKYHHKGAFFQSEDQDEEVKAALNRDIAGRKFVDDAGDKAVLPEYMRIRDMTRLGKKGRTKYQDLKNEDTGKWGEFGSKKRDFDGLDERFKPDERGGGGSERTGANAAPVAERRRRDDESGRDEKRPRYD
ncbi:Microfibrillar-associated 1 [Lecanosticta acicola]|uniref:Microfibrillar-associated 1 n=1 Tax=Lecanosticta acicola TaxID=111012 RepID=A0AAI9E404_9PEZI|nr:Microfibrillar-associated 1 [Lecanosticta acicola]